jgi:hypothetical protein
MWALIVAAACAGSFAGAAIYITAVEHPARMSCGNDVALREFAPSYRRPTVMQASLAVVGCLAGLWSAWVLGDAWVGFGALPPGCRGGGGGDVRARRESRTRRRVAADGAAPPAAQAPPS